MSVSAPTLIGKYQSPGNITSTGPVTATGSASIGELVMVSFGVGGAGQSLGFTDSASNVWTPMATASIVANMASTGQRFYSVLTNPIVSGSTTFTAFKGTSGGLAFVVEKFTGQASSSPVGAQETHAIETQAGSATLDAAVPVASTGLLHVMVVISNARTASPSGSLLAGNNAISTGTGNPRAVWTFYQQIIADGSVTPSVTFNSGTQWAMLAVPIAPGAAGGGGAGGAWYGSDGTNLIPLKMYVSSGA